MNRVIHFEIHAVKPEELSKFYEHVFGWEIKEWTPPSLKATEGQEFPGVMGENRYWGVMTAPEDSKEPGINGGMVVRQGPAPRGGEPMSAFVCTIHVSDVDEYLKKIQTAGGSVALGKMPIPGLAWLAYCKDLEGNIFGIYEDDKNAK